VRVRAVLKLEAPAELEGTPPTIATWREVEVELAGEVELGYIRSLSFDVESVTGGWDRMLAFPFALVDDAGEWFVKFPPDERLSTL